MIFSPPDRKTLRKLQVRQSASANELKRQRATLRTAGHRGKELTADLVQKHPLAAVGAGAVAGLVALKILQGVTRAPILGGTMRYAIGTARMMAIRSALSKVAGAGEEVAVGET